MKIEAYKIVLSYDTYDLSQKVTVAISDGWSPFGNLAVVISSQDTKHFYQPMVKMSEDNNNDVYNPTIAPL